MLALALACIGALALMASGCGGDDESSSDTSTAASGGDTGQLEEVVMTLPFSDSLVWSGYETARGPDGPYEEQFGMELKTEATEGGGYMVQQLTAGNIDYGVTGMVNAIISEARGAELVSIATVLTNSIRLGATPDSGVTAIEDLEGATIGVADLGSGEIPIIKAALADAGLEENTDYKLLPIGYGSGALNAVTSGEVQAVSGYTNDFVPLEDKGVVFTDLLPEEYQGMPDDVVVVHEDLLLPENEHRLNNVLDVIRGWYIGDVYGEQYPEDALARACEYAPADCKDMAFAEKYFEVANSAVVDTAAAGGCIDAAKVETLRDKVAGTDVPEAADIPVEELVTGDYCGDNLAPTDEDVQAFADRTGATG
jgi:NitT/TauT family transport system substrate-binding protein